MIIDCLQRNVSCLATSLLRWCRLIQLSTINQGLHLPFYLWNSLIYSAGSATEVVDRRTSVGLNRKYKHVECVFAIEFTTTLAN